MSIHPYRLAKHLRIAGGVGDVDLQVKPAVVGLLDGDGDVLGTAVIEQRLERLLGVLFGELADPWQVFGAFQLMQAGTHGGVFPPGAEGCREADINGVAQRIDTLARQVASGWVYACVHRLA